MDEDTRKVAIDKADAISDMIGRYNIKRKNKIHHTKWKNVLFAGYPEFIKDVSQLDERFDSLNIRNDTYFENNININYFNLRKNLEKIKEPVNKTTWS